MDEIDRILNDLRSELENYEPDGGNWEECVESAVNSAWDSLLAVGGKKLDAALGFKEIRFGQRLKQFGRVRLHMHVRSRKRRDELQYISA